MSDSLLPGEFSDLEPYAAIWCLPTEGQRFAKRVASTMDEIQAFYDAFFPRAEEAIAYCDKFPLDDMPEDAQRLLLASVLAGHGVVPGRSVAPAAHSRRRRSPHRPRDRAGPLSDGAIVLRASRWVDVDAGEVRSPAVIVVEGERIAAVNPDKAPGGARVIDLGDVTLLPGLMDMELNMLLGGPHGGNPRSDVQDDPGFRILRATLNCRTTLLAGFTTARNLGLFVKTGGYLLDVALSRAIDNGWIDGPRLVPAGHAITPTGGHLDPTMFQRLGPDIMPLSVEEGIANGIPEVRKAVRYQIKYGARVIKISASGGVMSHSGLAGAQQYSDEELAAIVDEAHRAGLKVAAHAHGDAGIRACIRAGVDCIEHGSLASDETIALMVEHGTFLVPTSYLSEGLDVSKAAPELQREGGGGVPTRPRDAAQGDRERREDRVRHRCTRDPTRAEREGAVGDGRPRHDPDAGVAGGDGHERRADQRRRPRPTRGRTPRGHHRGAGRPVARHHDHPGRAVRDEGWPHLSRRGARPSRVKLSHPARPRSAVLRAEAGRRDQAAPDRARRLSTSVSSGVPVGYTAAAPAASSRATSRLGIVPPTTSSASSAPAARSASAVFCVSATCDPLRMLSPTIFTSS